MTFDKKTPAAASAGRHTSYAVSPERMPAIPPEQMTDAQKRAAAELAAGPRGEVKGPFVPLLRSPEFLTEVLANKGASDATYARTVAKFGEQGVIDLLGVAGYYALLAMVMNVARTAVPEGTPLPLSPLPSRAHPI